MFELSPKLNRIIDLKDVVDSTQQIFKCAEKIRNAYEHLITEYETLGKKYAELKVESAKAPIDNGHKRRKTDESVINESNDVLNEAIQDVSSCVEDEIIESTPKPDVSRKNVSKKMITFKSPNKRIEIKLERFDDSKDEAMLDAPKTVCDKKLESPLRSVENQSSAGKENRQKNPTKWLPNTLVSPSRVSRSGFISAKSPNRASRLSLSRPSKQPAVEFKKTNKESTMDSCAETFFDGSQLPKQINETKGKFLRQQRLEACFNSSRDSDDENVFCFKSDTKPNTTSSKSPPNIKVEPQTEQFKASNVSVASNNIKIESNQTHFGSSSGSSVVALSGVKCETIVIEESQPLFDECSETFCEKLEFNLRAVESTAFVPKMSENENIVANHRMSCRQCALVMSSSPHLTTDQKLKMIDRCKYPTRPDTDPEFWNPRFVATPESQKQETLIDDRWATRKKKS